jgi:ribonuclease R
MNETKRPGADGHAREIIAARLTRAGSRGLEVARLRQELESQVGAELYAAALAELTATAVVVEVDGRLVAVGASGWKSGTLELIPSGDGIVRTGRGEPGMFVPQRLLAGAGVRDLVVVEPLSQGRSGAGARAERPRAASPRAGQRGAQRPKLAEARVVATVRRGLARLVGTVRLTPIPAGERAGASAAWLEPFDPRLEVSIVLGAGAGGLDPATLGGQMVVVDTTPAGPGGDPLRARIVEALGNADGPGVDVLAILRHFGIDEPFPAGAVAEASGFPADPEPGDWQGRLDLRGADQPAVVTIDGATARDFDDAVSVVALPGGGWRLGIHIADVSHYVRDGSALDLAAYERGTSVYFPDRAVPMLPEHLSNGLCSLRPNVPRLTLSAILDISAEGAVVARRFAESVIRSDRRLTYDEVRRLLEEPQAGDEGEYGRVLPALRDLAAAAAVLRRKREARGALDFDLPEGDVVLDTDGVTVGIRPSARHVAHRLIEELMLAANEAVAEELETRQVPALYRVHDAPDEEDLEELRGVLRTFGLDLPADLEHLHPSQLQKVLDRVVGRPEEAFVSALVVRNQQRALYAPECRGHYALAARYYCHFTSPIRRYPDLLVHRQLRRLLRGELAANAADDLAGRLPAMGEHCSKTERRAEAAEREILQWKKVRFLRDRVGERFLGSITGVQQFGLFVQLADLYVDGLVPIASLGDEYFRFEAESYRLIGETSGTTYRLAQTVEVALIGIDERRRGLELRLAGTTGAASRERSAASPWQAPSAATTTPAPTPAPRPGRRTAGRSRDDSPPRPRRGRNRKG